MDEPQLGRELQLDRVAQPAAQEARRPGSGRRPPRPRGRRPGARRSTGRGAGPATCAPRSPSPRRRPGPDPAAPLRAGSRPGRGAPARRRAAGAGWGRRRGAGRGRTRGWGFEWRVMAFGLGARLGKVAAGRAGYLRSRGRLKSRMVWGSTFAARAGHGLRAGGALGRSRRVTGGCGPGGCAASGEHDRHSRAVTLAALRLALALALGLGPAAPALSKPGPRPAAVRVRARSRRRPAWSSPIAAGASTPRARAGPSRPRARCGRSGPRSTSSSGWACGPTSSPSCAASRSRATPPAAGRARRLCPGRGVVLHARRLDPKKPTLLYGPAEGLPGPAPARRLDNPDVAGLRRQAAAAAVAEHAP